MEVLIVAVEEWNRFITAEPLEVAGKKLVLLRSGRMRPLGLITVRTPSTSGNRLTLVYGPQTNLQVDTETTTLTNVGYSWYEFMWLGVDYIIQRQL